MAAHWKRNSIWITGLTVMGLAAAMSIALGWNPVDVMLTSATVDARDVDGSAMATTPKRVQVASLRSVAEVFAQMTLAAGPEQEDADAGIHLMEADTCRESASVPEAVRAYILVLDKHPDTPQAKVADERFNSLLGGRTEAEMDAIETALPALEELTDVDGITAIAQFYFKRATEAAEKNPEQAGRYFKTIYEIAWPVFEDNLDDSYKTTLLDGYLQVADILEKGKETRAALTKLADNLPPCFTSWLIRAEVMGKEPPFEFVGTEQGQAAVRKYYIDKAKDAKEPEVAAAYYAKCRDVSWQMFMQQPSETPKLDDVLNYLRAAKALGESEHSAAMESVEKWIEMEPLSIKRWIARYELAMFMTEYPASEEESQRIFRSFEILVNEAESGIVETAINDASLDENLRGLLVCMWGHTYAGTNRIDDARICYRWVLGQFTNETHAGASASYSLAIMDTRQHYDDPAKGIAALESFADAHPGSRYSAEALMHVADLSMQSKDPELAKEALERVKHECQNTSQAKSASIRLEEMAQEALRPSDSVQPEVQ